MSLLHHSALGTQTEEDLKAGDIMFAAQQQGHEFIEVHLNPAIKLQNASRMTGARVIRAYDGPLDEYNIPTYEFAVTGGDIEFKRDLVKRKMVAFVLDDKEKGVVSPTGFNRDLLASHIDSFIVPDPVIAADIRNRADLLLQKRARDEKVKEEKSAEDYEKEIKELQAKRDAALNKTVESEPPKKPKRESKKTPEERKAWGEEMQAAKKKKAAEREAEAQKKAGIASLPKEEHAKHTSTSQVGAD